MLRGFATISLWAEDVVAAKEWYTEVLGIAPYFERRGPDGRLAYVEFRFGDYRSELGLIDRRYAPAGHSSGTGGTVVYCHVNDVKAAYDRLLSLGAAEHEAPTDREEGFITASVLDPFGNILGVMYNPHYLGMLASLTGAAAHGAGQSGSRG
ncbi:putative enzyme related to lactoylglutathione lyase [Nocardiopsis mwathae]|uniref:Putative enzyme related to lactoylglutathione lyase n=1 Tax=Nocardiopsis mwathae TaxID=1472723 RepID=A0A7W9YGK3_9ACTN|nr:VOC family protein [Nocardiopsis mwathae]MBB6171758.1 putative enzyme related to lactoylglutathione lyase [Nocardiopsis mwathae]